MLARRGPSPLFRVAFLRAASFVFLAAAAARSQSTVNVDLPDSLFTAGTQVTWVKKLPFYCEGVAVDLSDGTTYFTEQHDNNTLDWPIWKINPANPADTGVRWVQHSNQSNGLFVDGQGRVIAAQLNKVVRYAKNASVDSVLATSGSDATFDQANDFSMSKDGTIYFTDLGSKVFRRDPGGKTTIAASGLNSANGIEWIEEQNAVYVQAGRNVRYDIASDGTLINGKTFYNVNGPDGCEVDSHLNFYLVSYTEGVVYVVNAAGKLLGTITFNMQSGMYDTRPGNQGNVDNCHFGGADGKTLYCTGDGGLYAIPMKVAGRHWPAALPAAIAKTLRMDANGRMPKSYRADGRFWWEGLRTEAASPRLPILMAR